MNDLRQRKYLVALLLLLAVFAGCKGESPTAPAPGGGSGPGGGTAPPTNASISLAVANPNPIAGSSTRITATVTAGGQVVPIGTAVEFRTNFGRFEDSGQPTTLATTNAAGQTSVVLTSASAGTATVVAVVNNASATTTVTFGAAPVIPPPPNTTSSIAAINPSRGGPEGGTVVTVTGTNFRAPIRVFLDLGNGNRREAFVVPASITPTSFQFITPAFDLGAGQTLDAPIQVFIEQGTPNEQVLTSPVPFTYRRAQLTPTIVTVSPDQGPISSGTRITIFGDGFEAPVQVSFSTDGVAWSQMQVVNVTFTQIIAITPTARDVTPTGSGTLVGPVDLRVININSATEARRTSVFRYTPAMQITTARPLVGSSLGGTDVTIDGIGFDQPVQVFIGGVLAQVLRVSGTQILARTGALPSPCVDSAGEILVINTNNGDSATANQSFAFVGVDPVITSVAGTLTPGGTATVTVQNPGIGQLGSASIRFTINGVTIVPTPSVISTGVGDVTFTVPIPLTGFNFPTVVCTTSALTPGTQLGALDVTMAFVNQTTSCSDTLVNGLRIQPLAPNTCTAPPTAVVTVTAPGGVFPPTCANAPPVVAVGPATSTATITISNAAGARDLVISTAAISGAVNAVITMAPLVPPTITIPAGGSQVFTVTVDPTAAGPVTGTATFSTNDPARTSIVGCITGSGT